MMKARQRHHEFNKDDDNEEEMLPQQEIVARYSTQLLTLSCSVLERVGRTLKGRDLRRVKNVVFLPQGPPSQKFECQICLSSSSSPSLRPSSSSSSSPPKWSCKACTFLNPYKNSACEVYDTRCPVLFLSKFDDLNDTLCDTDVDSSIGSIFFPLRPCKRKALDPIHINDDDSAKSGGFRDLNTKVSNKVVDLTGDDFVSLLWL